MNDREPFPLVLFGAGASAPAGVPTAVEMTRAMMKMCREGGLSNTGYFEALRAITGALLMGYRRDEFDHSDEFPDIEQVVNAASLLGDRFALEFAPFVAAWHPIIEDLERRPLDFWSAVTSDGATSDIVVRGELEEALGRFYDKLLESPDGALFRGLTAYLTGKLIQLTWFRAADELAYLDPLITASRIAPITVASLNYDNALELRAGVLGVQCETRIATWSKTGSLPSASNGIDLIKLHGSVNWFWTKTKEEIGSGLSYRTLMEVNDDRLEKVFDPLYQRHHAQELGSQLGVIFGGRNKLTAAGPFLDLLVKFKTALEQHTRLLVVGYSFRDPHVNECIVRWINRDAARRVTIVDRPEALERNNPLHRDYERQLGERLEFQRIGAVEGIARHFGTRQ
jgi:hypothetical protein